jgi:TolB-like protein/class 3 adenylate cyclase
LKSHSIPDQFSELSLGSNRMTRKLTTILAADVVGYSQLIERDEQGTLTTLRKAQEVVAQAVVVHGGRIFGGAGDSVIAEFGSAVEATKAAISIQKELVGWKSSDAIESDFRFRIGLNLGDVVVEGDNLLGDGVNVAARIEALAEPGGICMSHAVFEQVRGKIDIQFDRLGQYKLKNIARRVSVYRVALDSKVRPAHTRWLAEVRRHRWALPAFVALFALVAGVIWWKLSQPTSTTRSNLSIAVMPLSTIGSDESTRRLADGLTEDIITDLSRFSNLEILASNTIAAYQDKSDAILEIREELGVSYLLQGTIQREGDNMRVSAQLLDLESGAHLWTQRWDRPSEDAFAVQSELAEQVAATLGSAESSAAITASEIRKVKSRPPASLQAYDFYLLAEEQNGKFTKEAVFSGIDYATRAIALDPNFARAYAVRARMHFNTSHYGVNYEDAMQAMEADARKAVELDPSGPQPRAALAWYYFVSGRNKEAEVQLRSALEVNPANITLLKMAAAVFGSSGHPEEGVKLADKVLKLDPLATSGTLNTIKDAYYFSRRFEDTIAVISRVPPDSRSKGGRLFLAFSLAFIGREDDARRARDQVLAAYPNISAELLLNQGWAFEREEDLRLFVDGFLAADVPVCAAAADLTKIEEPLRLPECS